MVIGKGFAHSVALVLVFAAAGAVAAQEAATARAVPVYAIATDRAGADVADLRSDEITVSVNGKPVPVVSFSRDRLPLSIVALLDTSKSVESRFEATRLFAAGFLGQLQHDSTLRCLHGRSLKAPRGI